MHWIEIDRIVSKCTYVKDTLKMYVVNMYEITLYISLKRKFVVLIYL